MYKYEIKLYYDSGMWYAIAYFKDEDGEKDSIMRCDIDLLEVISDLKKTMDYN